MNAFLCSLVMAFTLFTSTAYAQPATFNDIHDHWAKPDILNLSNQGLIAGHADGEFKPYDYITQDQFLGLMAQASHRDHLDTLPVLRHLSPQPWKASAIVKLNQAPTHQILPHHTKPSNTKPSNRQPARYLTRAEALALTVNIAQYPLLTSSQSRAILSQYDDAKSLPQWSQEFVATAVQHGLFSSVFPQKKAFRGDQYLRRGEAAHLINAILLQSNPP